MDKIAPHGPRWKRVNAAMVASQATLTYLNQIPIPNLKHLSISASRPIDQMSSFHEGVIPSPSSLVLDGVDLSTTRLTPRNLTTLKINSVMLGPSSFDALNGSPTLKQFEVHLDFNTLRHFDTDLPFSSIQLLGLRSFLIIASVSVEAYIAPFLKRFSLPDILSLTRTGSMRHSAISIQRHPQNIP